MCVCEPPVCQGFQFLSLQGARGPMTKLAPTKLFVIWTGKRTCRDWHGWQSPQLAISMKVGASSFSQKCVSCIGAACETCQSCSALHVSDQTCGSNRHVQLFAVTCFSPDMCKQQTCQCVCSCDFQAWQEVSHGLSLNPLKILLLCVDGDPISPGGGLHKCASRRLSSIVSSTVG